MAVVTFESIQAGPWETTATWSQDGGVASRYPGEGAVVSDAVVVTAAFAVSAPTGALTIGTLTANNNLADAATSFLTVISTTTLSGSIAFGGEPGAPLIMSDTATCAGTTNDVALHDSSVFSGTVVSTGNLSLYDTSTFGGILATGAGVVTFDTAWDGVFGGAACAIGAGRTVDMTQATGGAGSCGSYGIIANAGTLKIGLQAASSAAITGTGPVTLYSTPGIAGLNAGGIITLDGACTFAATDSTPVAGATVRIVNGTVVAPTVLSANFKAVAATIEARCPFAYTAGASLTHTAIYAMNRNAKAVLGGSTTAFILDLSRMPQDPDGSFIL